MCRHAKPPHRTSHHQACDPTHLEGRGLGALRRQLVQHLVDAGLGLCKLGSRRAALALRRAGRSGGGHKVGGVPCRSGWKEPPPWAANCTSSRMRLAHATATWQHSPQAVLWPSQPHLQLLGGAPLGHEAVRHQLVPRFGIFQQPPRLICLALQQGNIAGGRGWGKGSAYRVHCGGAVNTTCDPHQTTCVQRGFPPRNQTAPAHSQAHLQARGVSPLRLQLRQQRLHARVGICPLPRRVLLLALRKARVVGMGAGSAPGAGQVDYPSAHATSAGHAL